MDLLFGYKTRSMFGRNIPFLPFRVSLFSATTRKRIFKLFPLSQKLSLSIYFFLDIFTIAWKASVNWIVTETWIVN